MRHLAARRRFGRGRSSRRVMFRTLVGNLILHGRIRTPEAKPKERPRLAERIVTRVKRAIAANGATPQDRVARLVHARRTIGGFVPRFLEKNTAEGDFERVDLLEKVFSDLAPRFADRPGGYTRTVKIGPRHGDNAPMCLIEFLPDEEAAPAPTGSKGKAKPGAQSPKKPAKDAADPQAKARQGAKGGKKAAAEKPAKAAPAKRGKKKADEDE